MSETTKQVETLNLTRKDFVPDNDSWQLLGQFAYSYGLTRCHFFVIMLQVEAGLIKLNTKKNGVPIKYINKKFKLHKIYIKFTEIIYLNHNKYIRGLTKIEH